MSLFVGRERKKFHQHVGESSISKTTTMMMISMMNNNNNNNNLINNNNTNHHHHRQQQKLRHSISTTITSDGGGGCCTTTDKLTISSDSSGSCIHNQFGDDYRDVFIDPRHLDEIKGHDDHINQNWRSKERVCIFFYLIFLNTVIPRLALFLFRLKIFGT